jgi:phosphatidylinositol-3-phosphatase
MACTRWAVLLAAIVLWEGGRAQAQVATPDHIVIVMEENHAYSQIAGSASAPFINGLRSQGALLTNSFAVTHPSQPNYLALFSGSTQGVTSDSTPTHLPFTTPNLGAQLIAAGKTFIGYSESLPSVGYTGDNAGGSSGYYRKHNPWVNWQQSGSPPYPANNLPATVNVPFTQFPSDYTQLPAVSFVIPTQLNDMHDGSITQGDTWLNNNLNGYIQWAKSHNSVFLMTFDEDDDAHGNQIATLLVGQPILANVTSSQLVNHYNILATIEDMYGLPRIGAAVGVPALTGIFAPVPEPTSLAFVLIAAPLIVCRRWRRSK